MAYLETVNQGNAGDQDWPVIDAADGVPGGSTPTACVQVGGTDSSGILHAFLTDGSGELKVLVENTPAVNATLVGTPTVAVTGSITASFSPSGTQTVVLVGEPITADIVNTPMVIIDGVPTVAITGALVVSFSPSGTQTVVLVGQPIAVDGTVAVIGSLIATATISGTVAVVVQNTPVVTIGSQPIGVDGTVAVIGSLIATATISGTVSVSVANTPVVTIGSQPIGVDGSLIVTATISGTVAVNVANTPQVIASPAIAQSVTRNLAAGAQVQLTVDLQGAQRINPYMNAAVTTQQVATTTNLGNTPLCFLTVPAGQKWQIQGLFISVVSASNTGSRVLEVVITDSAAATAYEVLAGVSQTASVSFNYAVGPGNPKDSVAALLNNYQVPLPAFLLGPGCLIIINVAASAGVLHDSATLRALVIVYED
jgi:hypothetical protein